VPLPLLSYGGTSRVATAVILALLVRTSAGPWFRTRRDRRAGRTDGTTAEQEPV
jgi:cell division protein FtsW (lipid II flippase)